MNIQDCEKDELGLLEERLDISSPDKGMKIREAFGSWFNNNMAIMLMAIQYIRRMDPRTLVRFSFFLDSLEHHYLDAKAGKPARDALRYLRRYFGVYPGVRIEHSRRAIEMAGRIYEALGLTLKDASRYNPKISPELEPKLQ